MLPAIVRVEIPLFASLNDKVEYEIRGDKVYLKNAAGIEILAAAGTEIFKMWRVK